MCNHLICIVSDIRLLESAYVVISSATLESRAVHARLWLRTEIIEKWIPSLPLYPLLQYSFME